MCRADDEGSHAIFTSADGGPLRPQVSVRHPGCPQMSTRRPDGEPRPTNPRRLAALGAEGLRGVARRVRRDEVADDLAGQIPAVLA